VDATWTIPDHYVPNACVKVRISVAKDVESKVSIIRVKPLKALKNLRAD